VGVAPSKLVAKIASELRKPDGLVVVPPGTEAAFLAPLPIRRLWGVGAKTEESLFRLGVHTIGDLARLDPGRLGTHGQDLVRLARGEDERDVHGESDQEGAKSVGHEHTFDRDTAERPRLRRTLLELSDAVAHRLRRAGTRGRTVTLKYRDETFTTLTRAKTLPEPTDSGEVLFATAWALFEKTHGARKVRLLGVSVSNLLGEPQMGLFTAAPHGLDRVLDAVSDRFGSGSLVRASLLAGGSPGETADRKGSRRIKRER